MSVKGLLRIFFKLTVVINLKVIDSREVYWETSLGSLIGYTKTSFSGYEFYAFEGIPYAKPPLGDLRFKTPLPVSSWHGVLNATVTAPNCLGIGEDAKLRFLESEDCLYLNIYTRALSKNPINNIMIQINGGKHQNGMPNVLGPHYLMDEENFIYINFNYRLNIFGFFSLYDPSLQVPGNAGAKDIVMVLEWIRNYIQEFGGDPNRVTVSGCSTGGQLVNLLMLHPTASKLFHQGIVNSGSALFDYFISDKHYDILAHFTNYTGDIRNEREFLRHLTQMPTRDLVEATRKYSSSKDSFNVSFPMVISIESKLNNPNPFLTEYPDELILQGKFARMPTLASFAQIEGGVMNKGSVRRSKNYTSFFEHMPEYYIKRYLTKLELTKINQEIKDFYYGKEVPSDENKIILTNIHGDLRYLYEIILGFKTMAYISNFSFPLYMYEFNTRTNLNMISEAHLFPEPYCIHCDELAYIFSHEGIDNFHINDHIDKPFVRSTIKRMTRIITNFVRTGNPNSIDPDDELSKFDWQPVRSKHIDYLIVQPNLTMGRDPFNDRLKFWHKLYRRYLQDKNIAHGIFTTDFDLFP